MAYQTVMTARYSNHFQMCHIGPQQPTSLTLLNPCLLPKCCFADLLASVTIFDTFLSHCPNPLLFIQLYPGSSPVLFVQLSAAGRIDK